MASRLLQIVLIVSELTPNPDNIDSAMRTSLCRSRTLLDRPDSLDIFEVFPSPVDHCVSSEVVSDAFLIVHLKA
jgi:hypothetical protein